MSTGQGSADTPSKTLLRMSKEKCAFQKTVDPFVVAFEVNFRVQTEIESFDQITAIHERVRPKSLYCFKANQRD